MTRIFIFCIFSLCLILSGCGSKPRRHSQFDPYTVRGKTYYPLRSAHGFKEVGLASWYGRKFHGKRTASGEIYNQNAFTCAHKILPLGTKIKVTNLENNRSLFVKVNDRGPFTRNRVVDLSKAAAEHLNVIAKGSAKVRLEYVEPDEINENPPTSSDLNQSPPESSDQSYFIQLGSFAKERNVRKLRKRLKKRGFPSRTLNGTDGLYDVQAGPFNDLNHLEDSLRTLREDFPEAFIVDP